MFKYFLPSYIKPLISFKIICARGSRKPSSNHWALQDHFHDLPTDLTFYIFFFLFPTSENRVTWVKWAEKQRCEATLDLCYHLSLNLCLRLQRWSGTQLLVKVRWCQQHSSSLSFVNLWAIGVDCMSKAAGNSLLSFVSQRLLRTQWLSRTGAVRRRISALLVVIEGRLFMYSHGQTQSTARCFRKVNISPPGRAGLSWRLSLCSFIISLTNGDITKEILSSPFSCTQKLNLPLRLKPHSSLLAFPWHHSLLKP